MKNLSLVILGAMLLAPITSRAQSTINTLLDNPQIVGGVHTWIDSGKVQEYQSPTGRTVTSMTEYFLGFKSEAGWGVYGMAVEDQTAYGNTTMNTFAPGDPSISIVHPIYSDDHFKVSGKFREYFQVSDWAVKNQVYQQAYYLESNYLMKDRWSLFNVLIPRYFSQPSYAAGDTTVYCEDWTYLGRDIHPWLRVGMGQHAQLESHFANPVGKDWDIFPYADFMLTKTIFAGPRIYFPLYAQNSVYLGDKGVSLSNVQFELYVQAHL